MSESLAAILVPGAHYAIQMKVSLSNCDTLNVGDIVACVKVQYVSYDNHYLFRFQILNSIFLPQTEFRELRLPPNFEFDWPKVFKKNSSE